MGDLGQLVTDCRDAVAEHDPRGAVREVLERALAEGWLAASVEEPRPGIRPIHQAHDLTVLDVVWPPNVAIPPHDHLMWAAIAVYEGREDNEFFRRDESTLVASGGKELVEGDVFFLGDKVIHAVHNPTRAYTGAIHVYGGDLIATPHSQWVSRDLTADPTGGLTGDLTEVPYDFRFIQHQLELAEERSRATAG